MVSALLAVGIALVVFGLFAMWRFGQRIGPWGIALMIIFVGFGLFAWDLFQGVQWFVDPDAVVCE
jgi:hypothetical protein